MNHGGDNFSGASSGKDAQVIALVRAAATGDGAAWDAIVDRYVSLLWAVALRHGLHESDAADVVQITWLRLLEHIEE
ncbi:MAG TPA: sigma factor, partial [Kineosporiaceae bacterium]